MKHCLMEILFAFFIFSSILVLSSCNNNDNNTKKNIKNTAKTNTSVIQKSTVFNESANESADNKPSASANEINISDLKFDKFSKDKNGFLTYNDGTKISFTGVDVSSYSGKIDWKKVKNNGIDFAIIRIGGRGYGSEGKIYADEKAKDNIANAKKNNIKIGVYFYSQAVSIREAEDEAQFIIDTLDGTKLDLPVTYDFEYIDFDTARTDNISGKQMTEFAKAFCTVIKNAGYDAMVYGEDIDFYQNYNMKELSDIPIWVAQYKDTPDFNYNFTMWQYSTDGKVDGISGNVDMNIMFKNT